MGKTLAAGVAALLCAGRLHAGGVPDDVRRDFATAFSKGSYAVVVQDGIPTTSVKGFNAEHTDAYVSIDVTEEGWKPSEGHPESYQAARDKLRLGEVMRLVDVTYKGSRIDLRLVSVDPHSVSRGKAVFKEVTQEQVSTNFRFLIPPGPPVPDGAATIRRVEAYLRPFPKEADARAFGATLAASAPSPAAEKEGSSGSKTVKKEIRAGMSPDEVRAALGDPQEEVKFETKTRWMYPGMSVIFENGTVVEVKF